MNAQNRFLVVFTLIGALGGVLHLGELAMPEQAHAQNVTCGPGKPCRATTFTATATTGNAFSTSAGMVAGRFNGVTTDALRIQSNISAASVNSSTVPAIFMYSVNALDANDLILSVATNAGVQRMSVDNEGDTAVAGMLQFGATSAGAPTATDCDANSERGRLSIDTTNNRLYVCNGATRGWDYVALTD